MHLLCKRDYTFSGTLIFAQNLGRQTYTLRFQSCAHRSLSIRQYMRKKQDASRGAKVAMVFTLNQLHSKCADCDDMQIIDADIRNDRNTRTEGRIHRLTDRQVYLLTEGEGWKEGGREGKEGKERNRYESG